MGQIWTYVLYGCETRSFTLREGMYRDIKVLSAMRSEGQRMRD
jgi:hypothetical protein